MYRRGCNCFTVFGDALLYLHAAHVDLHVGDQIGGMGTFGAYLACRTRCSCREDIHVHTKGPEIQNCGIWKVDGHNGRRAGGGSTGRFDSVAIAVEGIELGGGERDFFRDDLHGLFYHNSREKNMRGQQVLQSSGGWPVTIGPTGFPVRDTGDLKTSNRSTAFHAMSPLSA